MVGRLWLVAIACLAWGCAVIASQPAGEPQHLFLGEYDRQTHGRMTWFDHLVEFDPGTFDVQVTAEYRHKPPRKIAVLPFTDTGSGNYVLDRAPVAVRKSDELADWRWTDSNRLRTITDGFLSEREFTTVNLVEVDAVLAAHGIDDDVKLSRVTPQQLGRWLGADAVVYGEVTHYEAYYIYLIAGWQVHLKIKMVSAQSGCPLVTASGTRYKMEVKPAIALRDIALDSAEDITDLRDVDLRRTEEEAAREIVWRIPFPADTSPAVLSPEPSPAATNPVSAPPEGAAKATVAEQPQLPPSSQVSTPRLDPSPMAQSEASPMPTASGAQAPATTAPAVLAAHKPLARGVSRTSAPARASPAPQPAVMRPDIADSSSSLSEQNIVKTASDQPKGPDLPDGFERQVDLNYAPTQELDLHGVAYYDPLDLATQTALPAPTFTCPGEALWNNDKDYTAAASRPERFFLPEQRNLSHGRKTILDRMIETDPETFPMRIDERFYKHPPNRVAVLPFQYTGSGNLQVNKLVPVTFHTGQNREKWRWTVGNRVRRTFTGFLAQREFEVVPLPEIDSVLKEHGIATYEQLMCVSPEQVGRWLGVDAVVYGNVRRYEGYYLFLIAGWTVALDIRMVSTVNSRELISAEGGRWAIVVAPALTPVDILIGSGENVVDAMRDIRIRRAEEEASREIILRIPELPEHTGALRSRAMLLHTTSGKPMHVLMNEGRTANPNSGPLRENANRTAAPN